MYVYMGIIAGCLYSIVTIISVVLFPVHEDKVPFNVHEELLACCQLVGWVNSCMIMIHAHHFGDVRDMFDSYM